MAFSLLPTFCRVLGSLPTVQGLLVSPVEVSSREPLHYWLLYQEHIETDRIRKKYTLVDPD
ncbi:hypothetical protein [Siphonobacter sp. BAB-5385]|uniref:hypothetical protein n=1 Tax=Siphonobacter sp. BAB-5385 TaxID=1864822 RepID=UPI0011401D15|nr:hypothetical protein [Siphonobacter sp. BAB-5385]